MRYLALVAMIATVAVTPSGPSGAAETSSWSGSSQDGVGRVEYSQRCGYECSEADTFELTCVERSGLLTIWIGADSEAEPSATMEVLIEVDDRSFTFVGETDEGGLFGATPSIRLNAGDPLLNALMIGTRFRIFFDRAVAPVFDGHLIGSQAAFSRHLDDCL